MTSSSTVSTRRNSLLLFLGILVAFVLFLMSVEISNVSLSAESKKPQNISHVLAAASECVHKVFSNDTEACYPDTVHEIDWTKQIDAKDILHEAALQWGCLQNQESIILHAYGEVETLNQMQLVNESDPRLFQILSQCPDVDLYTPSKVRGYGYCEDAAAYTKYLKARMLPAWVLKRQFYHESRKRMVMYHEICPKTPMLFFNHYWDNVPFLSEWPATKSLYLMPNIEMYEIEREHLSRADVILCKTAVCAIYVNMWFAQEGNPRGTVVMYTRHTTSNIAMVYESQLSPRERRAKKAKDFSKVKFLHAAGKSVQKGTNEVIDCWLSRPNLPQLELRMGQKLYDTVYKDNYDRKLRDSPNVILHTGRVEPDEFGRIISDATYFMCPSYQEGYGHYINQARASRALIFTTDVPPMNELITPSSGILIKAKRTAHDRHFLGGLDPRNHSLRNVVGYAAEIQNTSICGAVAKMLLFTTPEERARRADKALQHYYFDTVFFAHKMKELRAMASLKDFYNPATGRITAT
ncbi:hypothetical protein CCR75_007839 [Bremia lactucae]|uniref:Glycosyl transferase family 1 domain-containing protein n=1 Tax=Bremia lactucae TaxID=4779 RepID=A0A976ID63_BRELC|nr:hypothetical protein CCR75_007839 [Bremia lactucae]